MRLSIISPVLNSHEIVRRQLLYLGRMNLSDEIEIIYVDDGSEPPITGSLKNLRIIRTHDKRPWTEHIARNRGAEAAKGKYLAIIDIDYILPEETIYKMLEFNGDKLTFRRKFGVLNENGELVYDKPTLKQYGLLKRWQRKNTIRGHRSQYLMHRDLFKEIGGYREDLAGMAHPMGGGAGQKFYHKWLRMENAGMVETATETPLIFMFPIGKYCGHIDYNPLGLFHDLKRL